MVTSWTSVEEVIARVASGMGGNLPGQALSDMVDWIGEAMGQLKTKYQLVTKSTPSCGVAGEIRTENHIAPLPCGMVELVAVEDEYGRRMGTGSDMIDITSQSARYYKGLEDSNSDARPTTFNPNTKSYGDGEAIPWDGSDIEETINPNVKHYYKVQGNKIQTSGPSMFVKLHYLAIPTDKKGYPLVPDEDNYKYALEWYILMRLIGAGYPHPLWKGERGYLQCESRFEKYAARAIANITYPTVDQMEKFRRSWAERLIFPYNYWEDFGIGYEQGQNIGFI
jgi:hypothetical protein